MKDLFESLAEFAGLTYLSDLRYASKRRLRPAILTAANCDYPFKEWQNVFRYLTGKEPGSTGVPDIVHELIAMLP